MASWPLISAFLFIQGQDVTEIIQSGSQGQPHGLLPLTAPRRRMNHQQQNVHSPSAVSKCPHQTLQPGGQQLWEISFWLIPIMIRRRKPLASHFIFSKKGVSSLCECVCECVCVCVNRQVGWKCGSPKRIFRLGLTSSNIWVICLANFYCLVSVFSAK